MKTYLRIENKEKIIGITYIKPVYDKTTKKYAPPSLKLQEDAVIKTERSPFSPLALSGMIYTMP